MKNNQFENEQNYDQNDLSATELTAGNSGNPSNSIDDDTDIEDDSDDFEDEELSDADVGGANADLGDPRSSTGDNRNTDYADDPNGAQSSMGDNMDNDPKFTRARDV